MTLNPSSAGGLGACTPEQIGLTTVGSAPRRSTSTSRRAELPRRLQDRHGRDRDARCSAATTTKASRSPTPTATPSPNRCTAPSTSPSSPRTPSARCWRSTWSPKAPASIVKQAGRIEPRARRASSRPIFDASPADPLPDLTVELFGGPPRRRCAPPPTCGTYAVTADADPLVGQRGGRPAARFEIDPGLRRRLRPQPRTPAPRTRWRATTPPSACASPAKTAPRRSAPSAPPCPRA